MSRKLGNKLKSIRLKRNLSQTEMANILGYSGKGMISRLENDSAEMSYDKLMILLSRFGDEFEGEEIEPIIPVIETSNHLKTEHLLIKSVGFDELEDALSLKVAPHQRDFVADNAIYFAEAYAAERHGTKTECFVAYYNNYPIGFASIALGTIGALILGTGMSLFMSDLGAQLGLLDNSAMLVGVAAGVVGLVLVALAYPTYNRILHKERQRIAPLVLRLTDELMK